MVRNYENADCSLRKKIIVSFTIIFGTISFPISAVVFETEGAFEIIHDYINETVEDKTIVTTETYRKSYSIYQRHLYRRS